MTVPASADAGILRRHFVAIATGTYDAPGWDDLPVADEVTAIADWLTDTHLEGRAFTHDFPDLAADPDRSAIEAALRDHPNPWNARDAVVVFVTGHGEVVGSIHWTGTKQTDRSWHAGKSLRTTDVIDWLARPDGPTRVLLIIDTCFAGAIAEYMARRDKPLPDTWLILTSAGKDGTAKATALSAAIQETVSFLRTPPGQRVGTHDPYLLVSDFVDVLTERLAIIAPDQHLGRIYDGVMGIRHVCLPNPHYAPLDVVATEPARRDLALPRQDLERHWRPRALGTGDADIIQTRWLFTGRAAIMRELVATARGEHDAESMVTLVTGGAGCGKSAILARLVTLSDPTFRAAYPDDVAAIPADLQPEVGDVDAAIVASNRYPTDVLDQLRDAFGLTDPANRSETHTPVAELATHLGSLHRISTIVIDALDEALDPNGIVTSVVKPLADSGHARILLGVRSLVNETETGTTGSLAITTQRKVNARRLTVDDAPWWDQADIRGYAFAILTTTDGSPYAPAPHHPFAEVMADAIAGRVGRSFLVARLAATNLARRDTLTAPDDPAWLATLDADVVGVFRDDLHRARPDPADRRAAVDLLRAMAFSYGRGLPWGEIWPTVANAIADKHGAYGDRDIANLLASPLGAYLVTDVEDDTTVYRLFHQALRDTLRTDWQQLLLTSP